MKPIDTQRILNIEAALVSNQVKLPCNWRIWLHAILCFIVSVPVALAAQIPVSSYVLAW